MEDSRNEHAPVCWHLCWQAAMGRNFVADPLLAARVRNRLFEIHQAPGRILLDYLLTPSEIHVLSVLSAHDSPRMVNKSFASVVSRWVMQCQGTLGPVFAAAYREHRIETVAQARAEIRMLAWRTVALGLCRRPTYYRLSALRFALGVSRTDGFDARHMLKLFDPGVLNARRRLRRLIAHRPSKEEIKEWELTRRLSLAIGTVGPGARMAQEIGAPVARLVAAAQPAGVDGALGLLVAWVTNRLQEPPPKPYEPAQLRALVAGVAVKLELCPAACVARYFGRARATLCEQMAASRRRSRDMQILDTPVATIVAETLALTTEGDPPKAPEPP